MRLDLGLITEDLFVLFSSFIHRCVDDIQQAAHMDK